jgi:hypothetical protein
MFTLWVFQKLRMKICNFILEGRKLKFANQQRRDRYKKEWEPGRRAPFFTIPLLLWFLEILNLNFMVVINLRIFLYAQNNQHFSFLYLFSFCLISNNTTNLLYFSLICLLRSFSHFSHHNQTYPKRYRVGGIECLLRFFFWQYHILRS